ncbi:MAG TPA: hypothetical protein VF517_10885 [Thermoleophilaceae bacterium]|jgi:hypothetical protein
MWDWADAWLLQSITYAGRRGDLRAVIHHADYINVDIPTRDDIERSVNRLAAAGLVEPSGLRLRATRQGRKLVRQSGRWSQGLREVPPRLTAKLRDEVAFPSQPTDWSLSEEDWQAAYDRYYPPEKRAAAIPRPHDSA